MKFLIVLALLAASCNAHVLYKRANGDQEPKVWDALKQLRGGKDLTTEEIQDLLNNAVEGKDYPINAVIPDKKVDCKNYKQAGFYADDSAPSKCQVFVRCDENGNALSFLCPNRTLFNQITLVCDWFVNVDCSKSKQFQDYSNSRLADQNAHLLDDQMDIADRIMPTDLRTSTPAPAVKDTTKAVPANADKVIKTTTKTTTTIATTTESPSEGPSEPEENSSDQ